MKLRSIIYLSLFVLLTACGLSEPTGTPFGTSPLDIRSLAAVSEVHWSGSVLPNGSLNNPDDDFIEIKNYYKGPLDISGWTVEIYGEYHLLISIPTNTVLYYQQIYTIGNNTNGAFQEFDLIEPMLRLPASGFTLKIYDGGGAKSADSIDFTQFPVIPAGFDLPLLRKSAVRVEDYFGAKDASIAENWASYNSTSYYGIRLPYIGAVYASPGSELGGVIGTGGGDTE